MTLIPSYAFFFHYQIEDEFKYQGCIAFLGNHLSC